MQLTPTSSPTSSPRNSPLFNETIWIAEDEELFTGLSSNDSLSSSVSNSTETTPRTSSIASAILLTNPASLEGGQTFILDTQISGDSSRSSTQTTSTVANAIIISDQRLLESLSQRNMIRRNSKDHPYRRSEKISHKTRQLSQNNLTSFKRVYSQEFPPLTLATQSQTALSYNPTYIVRNNDLPVNNKETKKDSPKEYVTKKQIKQWNTQIGNLEIPKKANHLIDIMRKLAGLDLSNSEIVIDIPSARLGLCMLANLRNKDIQKRALNSLLEILKKDTYTTNEATGLIELATELLELMSRENIQTLPLEEQNKVAEVYSLLAENLNQHFITQNINGITYELKTQLINTATSLKALNRLRNPRLKFSINCALVGVSLIKDDSKPLFKLLEGIYHLIASGVSFYYENTETGFEKLEAAFQTIDWNKSHSLKLNSWYSAILILKNLARNVNRARNLNPVLLLIKHQHRLLDWKFSFAAIDILFDNALNGRTAKLRKRALLGDKKLKLPGLLMFLKSKNLRFHTDFSPVVHLNLPTFTNPNKRIHPACVEKLVELYNKSQDSKVIKKTGKILQKLLQEEKDEALQTLIKQTLA